MKLAVKGEMKNGLNYRIYSDGFVHIFGKVKVGPCGQYKSPAVIKLPINLESGNYTITHNMTLDYDKGYMLDTPENGNELYIKTIDIATNEYLRLHRNLNVVSLNIVGYHKDTIQIIED